MFHHKTIVGVCIVCLTGVAALGQTVQPSHFPRIEVREIQLEAFVRSDRDSAAEVQTYLEDLDKRIQGLDIQIHDVLTDQTQLVRLYELSKKFGRQAVVPAFYCCDRMYFGFGGARSSGPAIENLFTADVYTRSTCDRCRTAKRFISQQLNPKWPAIRFRIHEVTGDINARRRWEELCSGAGQLPGLPTFDFARHVIVGYQGDHITGRQLEQLIEKVSGTTSEKSQPKPQDSGWYRRGSSLLIGASPMVTAPLTAIVASPLEEPLLDQLALPEEAGEEDIGEGVVEKPPDDPCESDQGIPLPVFGTIHVDELGLPAFTFAVGLVDGFNPCAMWVLVFLLSVLVNIRDRRKIIAIAGTFVLVSGLAYFAFMAAWLKVFMFVGAARPIQITLGLFAIFIGVVNVKDFFAFKKGISLSIPESSKPGLYRRVREIVSAKYLTAAIAGAISLAVVVNMVELLCTAGLPALYTQVLTMQQLPEWQNYLYLGLYISAYMLDDSMLLAVVIVTLSHRKLQEREGRWLKLISGLVILALGLVMIFRPGWLQLGH